MEIFWSILGLAFLRGAVRGYKKHQEKQILELRKRLMKN